MISKLRGRLIKIHYVPKTLGLIWAAAPAWTTAWAALLFAQGLLPAAVVYLTRPLVDNLVATVGGGASWETIRPTVLIAIAMAVVVLLVEVAGSVGQWVRTVQAELIADYFSGLIHHKSAALDLAFYESPEYHDRLVRARDDLNNRPLALLESIGSLIQNAITLLAMGALLIPFGFWLPLALIISTMPALYVLVRSNFRYHHWWETSTPDRRRSQYYDMVLTEAEVAPELRLFGMAPQIQLAFRSLRSQLRSQRIRLSREQLLAHLGAGLVGVVISGLALLWMIWRAFIGAITLGDLALFYQSFNRGQGLMHSLLGSMGQIYSHTLFLGNMFEFLNLKSEIASPANPISFPAQIKEKIQFREVTFRYPGTDHLILGGFDLTIPAGQVVAIVGPNGAGKSTLIKLLCRFYDPESGQIELDGIDLRNLSLEQLREQITVLFQWPIRYHFTAGQNIALGDQADADRHHIELAARAAGAHDTIVQLPRGYDTQLGRSFFGGAELSGGEWQRLALARAFLRKSQIMILDEPTSHLDSWAEVDWFDRFRALSHGRTAIIITHRFTIARRADVIFVMDSGRIVESGSHDHLMALGGMYAESWHAQVQTPGGLTKNLHWQASSLD